MAQIERATLDGQGHRSESLHVFRADISLDQVLVAGGFEDFLDLAVVVVTTTVFERGGYLSEGGCVLGVLAVGAAEVAGHDVGHILHLAGVFHTAAVVEFGCVAFDDTATLRGDIDAALGDFAGVDVAVLVDGVDVGLEAVFVGEDLREATAAAEVIANSAAAVGTARATGVATAAVGAAGATGVATAAIRAAAAGTSTAGVTTAAVGLLNGAAGAEAAGETAALEGREIGGGIRLRLEDSGLSD